MLVPKANDKCLILSNLTLDNQYEIWINILRFAFSNLVVIDDECYSHYV